MGIEFEDREDNDVSRKKEERDRRQEIADALIKGNESLIFTFELLAKLAEDAAEEGDLIRVQEALELIDLLSELGYANDRE